MRTFKYLHPVGESHFYLDHRLTPEVRALLCAQASRSPKGGVQVRYEELVRAVAVDFFYDTSPKMSDRWNKEKEDRFYPIAEDRLCEYPLHPRVQEFFDENVKKYGHSSPMELTGNPAVYSEKISWFTAWLLFDSPLCAGQEFSTRAVRHADWPMCRESYTRRPTDIVGVDTETSRALNHAVIEPLPMLKSFHSFALEMHSAEVEEWAAFFKVQENRDAYGLQDKEPFRPALDRARWALPGTFATGCSQTSHLRDRERTLRTGRRISEVKPDPDDPVRRVWEEMTQTYLEALPGLAGMGLREAVYRQEDSKQVPGHLMGMFSDAVDGDDAEVMVVDSVGNQDVVAYERQERGYLDPILNTYAQTGVIFRCALSEARDWHRHRTFYPWFLQVLRDKDGLLQLDRNYGPKSGLGIDKQQQFWERATKNFDYFMNEGDLAHAALCLPLGTRVRLEGWGGLRDAVYMLELRKNAPGANFAYKKQATEALQILLDAVSDY